MCRLWCRVRRWPVASAGLSGCLLMNERGGSGSRLRWGGTPVVITMDSPKVKCLECGAKTWHQPTFASGQRRVTKAFQKSLEAWLSKLTIQDAAQMFGVAWQTVSEMDLARLKKLPRPKLSGIEAIPTPSPPRHHSFLSDSDPPTEVSWQIRQVSFSRGS